MNKKTKKSKEKIAYEKSVGAVVFHQDKSGRIKFLLLHYPSGHWDFSKGHQEKGESDEETLRREIKEETGIKNVKVFKRFKGNVGYSYQAKGQEKRSREKSGTATNVSKKVYYYLAQSKTKKISLSYEHIGYSWFSCREALKQITFKNSRDILKNACEFLAGTFEKPGKIF